MLIQKFGVTLHPLTEQHLELLRKWRNSDFVQKFMQQQVAITPQEQKSWFDSLDKKTNHYFIIEIDGSFIGCCNIKNIDADGVGEGGVFLSAPEYLNGMHGAKAVFLMYEWAFNNGIINAAKSEILLDNKRAIRFNKMLGFTINIKESIVEGFLNKESFCNQFKKLHKTLNQ